jgi:uncharacterized protein (DUF2147 family)
MASNPRSAAPQANPGRLSDDDVFPSIGRIGEGNSRRFAPTPRKRKMTLRLRFTAAIACAVLAAGYAQLAPAQDNSAAPAAKKAAVPAAKQNATSPSAKPTAAPAAPLNQFKTAAGFWQQVDDDGFVGGWFFFVEKNGLYEGRLVKMFKKPGSPEYSDKCDKCEGDQKDAAMLGLTIVKGMKRDGHKYEEGNILDPRDGTVYHAQMELSPDGKKLSVRGYLGIPLLGQTQVWNRLPDDAIAPTDIPKESLGPSATPE